MKNSDNALNLLRGELHRKIQAELQHVASAIYVSEDRERLVAEVMFRVNNKNLQASTRFYLDKLPFYTQKDIIEQMYEDLMYEMKEALLSVYRRY